MDFDRKKHWENIYDTKQLTEVSWYQPKPETSLSLLEQLKLPKDAAIIDVGGGDSFLVDNLLELGYTNITVLDIFANAIKRAKNRLGEKAQYVEWIVSDITDFNPDKKYDLWHDRAVFHFLTSTNDIETYTNLVSKHTANLIIATFSEDGPLKCSGIEITQYSTDDLVANFSSFTVKEAFNIKHPTPFNTKQDFSFCILISC